MLQFFWRRLRRDQRGFTLIELLIVVAIIAILAAILIPNFLRARLQARISATKGNLKNIGTSLESYFVDADFYPASLAALAPAYIRATPTKPGGGAYTYNPSTAPAQDYAVCDTTTDTTTTPVTVWYYSPGGGLAGAAACPAP